MPRAVCPISKASFLEEATSLEVVFREAALDARHIQMNPIQYGTGSLGWQGQGTIEVVVAGIPVQCIAHLKLVVKGSKG